MRRSALSVLRLMPGILVVAGCSKGPATPAQPSEDPSVRTTTLVNPPSSPEEMATQCDVPIFPSAKAPDGMSRMPRTDADGTHYDLVLTTTRAPRLVAAFYEHTLRLPAKMEKGAYSLIGLTPKKKNQTIVTVNSEAGQTVIRIKAIVPKR